MEAVKPVFVARAERERYALERVQAAVADQRRTDGPGPLRRPPSSSNSYRRESASSERHLKRDWNRDRGLDQDYYLHQDRKRGRDGCECARQRQREGDEQEKMDRDKELEAIKEQYLGSKKPKKKAIKPSEKFHFSFDWDKTEDTSSHGTNFHQSPHEAGLLFGRGFLAGIDRRQQKRKAAAEHDKSVTRAERHWSEKSLDDMTERDWRVLRDHFEISYKHHHHQHGAEGGGGGGGSNANNNIKPMRKWSESNLGADLLRAVHRAGYRAPSPIQMATIPLGLQQRDVIGVAETGSGKTAAFVLPMLAHVASLPPISDANKDQGPYAAVLVPTRELAQQIEAETIKLARYLPDIPRVVSIVGGRPDVLNQAAEIADKGCEIVIATPGRLLDLLDSRYVVLNQCNYIVLDEADRMVFDPTFEQQVVGVLDAMPSTNLKPAENEPEELDDDKRINNYRTTYMFSATMPPVVERLARKYLRNPVVVTIGTAGGTATDSVTQNVVMVKSESDKMSRLRNILGDLAADKQTAIVFCNTRKMVDIRAKDLDKAGFRVTTLHGGKSQEQREASLDGFRNRRFSVLVATDLAARGIDIPDVARVVNYEMPGSIEAYMHRIGRTGRAGKKGVATSFLTLRDTDIFYHLKQMLVQSNSHVPPELAKHRASKFKPGSVPDR